MYSFHPGIDLRWIVCTWASFAFCCTTTFFALSITRHGHLAIAVHTIVFCDSCSVTSLVSRIRSCLGRGRGCRRQRVRVWGILRICRARRIGSDDSSSGYCGRWNSSCVTIAIVSGSMTEVLWWSAAHVAAAFMVILEFAGLLLRCGRRTLVCTCSLAWIAEIIVNTVRWSSSAGSSPASAAASTTTSSHHKRILPVLSMSRQVWRVTAWVVHAIVILLCLCPSRSLSGLFSSRIALGQCIYELIRAHVDALVCGPKERSAFFFWQHDTQGEQTRFSKSPCPSKRKKQSLPVIVV